MEHISATVVKLIGDWHNKESSGIDIVRSGLSKLLSKKEQKHIKSYSLRENRLILGVDSSVWLYLLNLKKRSLLRDFNQFFGAGKEINEIIIRLDIK